jgi:hypothetical protein
MVAASMGNFLRLLARDRAEAYELPFPIRVVSRMSKDESDRHSAYDRADGETDHYGNSNRPSATACAD